METGRLTLIELLGRVLNAYRSRHLDSTRHPDAVLLPTGKNQHE